MHSPPPPAIARSAGLSGFSPAYFGMVMATGIVSIAAHLLQWPQVADGLFVLNLAAYAVLWLLNIARLIVHPREVARDLVDHLRGPGFFTVIAASGVLGSQCLMLSDNVPGALALWCVALVSWLGITYAIFTVLTVKQQKPTLDRGINGGWLLAVVATQSIAVLSALLAPVIEPAWRLPMNFLALSMWLWGGMLYTWMMALIFYRYLFFPLGVGDMTPPYWINMGAMAISTLAGSLLIGNAVHASLLQSLLPFLEGVTVLYWATGSWWIPMLLLLGLWRYVQQRFPLRYGPLYWSVVFPLGMYAAGTHEMVLAMDLDFLAWLPRVFLYVALAAWVAAFIGVMRHLAGLIPGYRGKPAPPER